MSLTKIGSIGINTGIAFAGVTTIATLNGSDAVLSVGGTVNFVSDVSIGGTVSIAGTLTYEDVTNVDAVGLITARNGIVVGSGVTLSPDGDGFFTGVITATSYSGIDLSDVTGATGDFSIADKIVHTGDTNTAIRFPAADTVTVETGGSEIVRIDSAGYVGINDSAAEVRFHVRETTGDGSSRTLAMFQKNHTSTSISGNMASNGYPHALILENQDTSSDQGLSSLCFSKFTSGSQSQAVIAGISESGGNMALTFNTESSNGIGERLRIDSTGRLLLNTTTEGNAGADDFTIGQISGSTGITIRSGTTNNGNLYFSDGTSGDDEYRGSIQYQHANNSLHIATDAVERLRIQSSGDILFGNYLGTTNQPRVFFLDSTGNFPDQSNRFGLRISNGSSDASIRAYSNSNNWDHVKFYSTHTGSIVTAGSISQSGGNTIAYNTSSDYRLKENEVAISDGITRLKQLKPYRFNWKTDTSKKVDGFFAHEVSGIVPEAISGEKDAVVTQSMIDAGEIDEAIGTPVYQQIDQAKLVPLLTAALQEAVTKIEALEARVATLEGS